MCFLQKEGNIKYIQVTYEMNSEETIDREFGAYKGVDDNYPKYVVTMDSSVCGIDEGIKIVHIRDFLLKINL